MEMTSKQWHRYLIKKLCEYLYKNSINGGFVECGVKQGSSSVIMARELKTDGYLFDTWKGFPHFHNIDATHDRRRKQLQTRIETARDTYSECVDNLKNNGVLKKCTMIRGDICKTVPDFCNGKKIDINFLHIDTDLYEPAKVSLECFLPMVVKGGIIFFHDYGDGHWPGITKIVDGMIEEGMSIHIFDKSKLFSAFVVKDVNNIDDYVRYIK